MGAISVMNGAVVTVPAYCIPYCMVEVRKRSCDGTDLPGKTYGDFLNVPPQFRQ
jgi:hypothetical protein